MYLSDRDLRWAIEKGMLIVEPPPGVSAPKIDPTSIDLRLDHVREAKVWDVGKFEKRQGMTGVVKPEIHLGAFKFGAFAEEYLIPPPAHTRADRASDKVCLRGEEVLVRPGGFLLWQTKEEIGTPKNNPGYICFIDGKSTRARTGILVHLTAPTIHAGWSGNVVLEIANLGPFTFVLREDDVIAQLTVATVSSPPQQTHAESGSSDSRRVGFLHGRADARLRNARGRPEADRETQALIARCAAPQPDRGRPTARNRAHGAPIPGA